MQHQLSSDLRLCYLQEVSIEYPVDEWSIIVFEKYLLPRFS